MKEDRPRKWAAWRSWLDRLNLAVLGEPRDRRQLTELLHGAERRHLLDGDALTMIEGVLQVSEMQVRDVMIPRAQMVVVSRDATPEQLLPIIVESGHSRFPVVGDSRDEIAGILLAKDLLRYYVEGSTGAFNLREALRPAVFIPESKRLNMLLKEFRASRNHMAIVVDEYGGVAGLVTIEDVLEQIVGEIDDEHDIEEGALIFKQGDNRYAVRAITPVQDFNDHFGTAYSDQEFDTIGGLLMHALGHLPKRGETVTLGALRFKVVRADNRRLYLLHVSLSPGDEQREQVRREG